MKTSSNEMTLHYILHTENGRTGSSDAKDFDALFQLMAENIYKD